MNHKHQYQNPDLHMHSNFSDGSDSPEELLENVKKAGVDLFTLTDHDCLDGCRRIEAALRPGDPTFLRGVELSCEDAGGKYHILGFNYDPEGESIRAAVELTHRARRDKTVNRIRFLREEKGFEVTDEDAEMILRQENPGRPHFVNLLMEKGYVTDRAEGFRIMAEYHGNEPVLSPEDGVRAILNSGGIPVLAHGILADGSKKLTEEQITERVDRLSKAGLRGLECFYSSYTEEQKTIMLKLADRYHLLVTAGSDYHGSNKTVRLGETDHPDPERMKAFYEAIG